MLNVHIIHQSSVLVSKKERFFFFHTFVLITSLILMLLDICSVSDSAIVGNSRNYLRILRSWLSPVAQSVNSAWKRCWRATVDGWAASTFHSRCDGKGPTVTIIRVGRYIFGGYTSVSWGKWTL